MDSYKAVLPVTVNAGIVALTKEQHKRRAHAVSATDNDGIYTVNSPIMFKAGEEFDHDGDLSKLASVIRIGNEVSEVLEVESEELDPEAETEELDPEAETEELDSDGDAWDAEIHTASKAVTNSGKWKRKPGR